MAQQPADEQEAQTEDAVSDEAIEQAVERSFEGEVTITGSLIPRADLTALSPVTVMEVPQELTYSGIVRIEDLVVSLPQVWAGQNSTIANGAPPSSKPIDTKVLPGNPLPPMPNSAPGRTTSLAASNFGS